MMTVFYDGQCGLCSKEINYYQKIAPKNQFEWVDITTDPAPFTALGYTVEEGLKALHVQDNYGEIHTAIAAFIQIWRKLPRFKYLAAFINLPIIFSITSFVYKKFANWRFKKLGYQCRLKE